MPNLTNTPKIINKIGDKVNASDLGRVAFTNQYSDLDGIPSQTVVNNATVTFKKNGTTVQTITNNQASDAEVNYEITKTDVGLGNVDNTADINKPVSNAVSVELGKKANKTEVYTKAETDAAISASISSVYKYKGSKPNLAQIQAIVEKLNGDVWNAEDTDINYAWNGSRWDPLGGTVDLSGYLTKSEASITYLPTANAAALYLTKIDAANTYLPSDTASSTYLSKSEASSTYATNDSVSDTYLSKFDAANTYATNAGVDNTYLSKSDAANTYLSQSSASQDYATKDEVAEAVENIDGISTTQPSTPSAGSTYYDTTEGVLKIYNGTEWIVAGEGQDHIVLTRQEYDALTPEEKADPNKIYFIKGGQSGITVEWSNVIGRPTALSDFTNDTGFVSSSNVLTKDNTSTFTPSTNYQPATKKYVDDAVAAGGGGGASVSDEAYSSSWDGVGTIAPSKNAIYDKIQNIISLIPTKGSIAPIDPTEGMIWYDTSTDILKTYDGTKWNVTSDFPGMTILEYGVSTWQDFVDADNRNAIVYCKVPSATGLRMAFLAYQNTDSGQQTAEFQYYRSISSKSDSAQGDEVYIYKLIPDNGGTWNTSTRKTYSKIAAGTNMTSSYASGTLTLNANSQVDNTAYNSSWSSDTTHAPSKSAVYTALGDIITLLDNI